MRWIGIDLHKHYFHVVELAADGTNKSYRVAIPGGFGEFCAGLGPADQVVLEASTSSFRFGELVANHAGRVLISEPRQTRGVVSKPAMNDQKAAEALARLLQADFVRPVWLPPAEVRGLRCQADRYRKLDRARTQTINRIKSLFRQELTDYQPGITIGVKSHQSLAQQFLDQPAYRLYLCSLLRQLNLFNAELAEIEGLLGSWSRGSKEAGLLMSIPGMGPVLAAILMAEIGDISRFPSAGRLCSYAGLVPRVFQSGTTFRSGHITRKGRSAFRWALSLCIWCQSKYPTTLIQFKKNLAQKRPKMLAHVATCRKLLAIIWSMLHHGVPFREEDPGLNARKACRLERWPEPSPESLVVPKIDNPRPTRKCQCPRPRAKKVSKPV